MRHCGLCWSYKVWPRKRVQNHWGAGYRSLRKRHDRPSCRPGRRPVDHLADHPGKDGLAGAGQREGGGVGHDRARARGDLRIDGADEDLIGGKRRNLGGDRLEMMHSQRARWRLGEDNLVVQRGVQRDTSLVPLLPRSGATPQWVPGRSASWDAFSRLIGRELPGKIT
jgi:hypothetical protein